MHRSEVTSALGVITKKKKKPLRDPTPCGASGPSLWAWTTLDEVSSQRTKKQAICTYTNTLAPCWRSRQPRRGPGLQTQGARMSLLSDTPREMFTGRCGNAALSGGLGTTLFWVVPTRSLVFVQWVWRRECWVLANPWRPREGSETGPFVSISVEM